MGLRGGFGTSVYVMDPDGSNQRSLAPSIQLNGHPSWSPDGSRIAFNGAVDVDANADVYGVSPDGSALINLTQGIDAEDRDGAWSPDGSQLVFVTTRDGNQEVYRVNDDATGPLRLTVTEFFSEGAPAWSRCP